MPLEMQLESAQGQAGQGLEKPVLVEGVPPHDRGVEVNHLYGGFQPKPFWDSVNALCCYNSTEHKQI